MESKIPQHIDLEKNGDPTCSRNSAIQELSWQNLNFVVKDRKTKKPKHLVQDVSGNVKGGEILALMGPSGSGKTTLLNLLARRHVQSSTQSGSVTIDGETMSDSSFQSVSSFVEQEDALIGSLTVRETIDFSFRLSPTSAGVSPNERKERVDALLKSFGLTKLTNTLIGTPIRKGVSGGEKRRTSVAAALITNPSILFLDEPTSGLDSAASHSVISHLRNYSRRHNMLVIASIHQPSSSTFQLFDKLLLLSQAQTCFFGSLDQLLPHFTNIGLPIPDHTNPAEHLLDLVNVDFASSDETGPLPDQQQHNLDLIHARWTQRQEQTASSPPTSTTGAQNVPASTNPSALPITTRPTRSPALQLISTTTTLLHRTFLKSHRDVIAYGIRLAMYIGLAIMMGTVWLRLPATQSSIQPFINAIFFGSAFMSFMAVAYVPAFLEDRATFAKDLANGLYGPLAFSISNFLVGVPYLFLFSLTFSVIVYWLIGLSTADSSRFGKWVMWIFLDLLAAESLVVFVSSLLPPNFVLSLAVVAFANGLWMSVGGFLVSPTILNVFWRYVFHYIDYQAYVFQGMMVNEFESRSYGCGEGCKCMYDSALRDQCRIEGAAVLEVYGYARHRTGKWVGILIAIIAVYRLFAYASLRVSRR